MNWKYPAALIGLLLACTIGTMVQAAGPSADYEINSDYTVKSPDGTTTVEQYDKTAADGDLTWQFWARRQDNLSMLQPEQPDYAAGFRFTTDSRWLVRMQKTGSGEAGLYLYKLGPQGFVAATAKPFSDLAWNYFKSLPDSRKIRKPDFHIDTDLVKGIDDNYHQMGENWPDSRYLIITLSGDVLPTVSMARFRRFGAGTAGMTCKQAASTCRRILPKTTRKRLRRRRNNDFLHAGAIGWQCYLPLRRLLHPPESCPRPFRRS